MITLRQLQYLVAVGDFLHFRRAAEHAHVSQPTLSGQIQELEDRLGVRLVERSRSRVLLTHAGQEIVARARTILRDVGEVVDYARHAQRQFEGTLRLGVLPTLGPYLLPNVFPELHQRYPDLKLYVREGLVDGFLAGLADGRFDVLITPLPIQATDVQVAPLFHEPLMIAIPADHPLAAKPVLDRRDIKGQQILTLEPGHRLRDQVRGLCEAFGATLASDYEGTSLDALRLMVQMGMGLSFLPALYVRTEARKDPQVVIRSLRTNPPSRFIGMVWRRQSARHEELTTIAEIIRAWMSRHVPEVTVVRQA